MPDKRMNNADLMELAQMTWEFARNMLRETGEFFAQATLVNDEGLTVFGEPAYPLPPYELMRVLLQHKPSTAFVFVGESWSVLTPKEIAGRGMEAVEAWYRNLPPNLEQLAPELRGESLMMIAVGLDFSLQRIVNFRRVDDAIEFDEERPRSEFGEGPHRFFNLRELLVRPQGQQDG